MRLTDEERERVRNMIADPHLRRRDGEKTPLSATEQEDARLLQQLLDLEMQVNSPQIDNFLEAVKLEAVHQRARWGADHDVGKTPEDWLWLLGYLATKATQAARYDDRPKFLHHIVTTAAAALNWHAHATGEDTRMRPGIDPVARGVERVCDTCGGNCGQCGGVG